MILYINGFVSTSSTELWKVFFFQISYLFVSEILAENRKNIRTNSEAGILIKVQCFMYQWILLDKFYKLMEVFSYFEFVLEIVAIGRKPENIRTNREAWILMKVQCFIFQWIRLDMLYICRLLMKAFVQISEFRISYNFVPSVCTTIFKRIAGLCFYPKYLMLYINEFVSTSSTKNEFVFELMAENHKIFKRIATREY